MDQNAGKLFDKSYWEDIPIEFETIFDDKNKLFTNGSFTPTSSAGERFAEGFDNAQNLIKMLDKGDILEEGETIKIMGHSQGAAYAAGLAAALLQHPTYKHLVEFVVYLAPDQPNQFVHPAVVPGYQFSTMSDWVSSKGFLAWARDSGFELIDGATWASKRYYYQGSRGGHGVDSWVWEVLRWASQYNIPVTVVE
ncbi:MAG: PE-PPE domain-containing protein [Lentimicrobium sp.]|uniref:PE-PPE domain-containing protein n=1 Tax=Lentimicrobium sp. TaxID=2034841 RepID=UPI0025F06CDF|nr:PE-PPE domain-containing protein [Lentimicrobium sp.]MCO5255469.1 PE-PPE domain-containing protein [Lentimicrobium sp.]